MTGHWWPRGIRDDNVVWHDNGPGDRWDGVTGRFYNVLFTHDLVRGNWSNVPEAGYSNMPGQSGQMKYTNTSNQGVTGSSASGVHGDRKQFRKEHVNGRSKKMTSGWQCLFRQCAAFAVALLMFPFPSWAQIALDQSIDTDATTPPKQVVEQTTGSAGKPEELKVCVSLKDGSQIIGTPVFKALTVTTPYGKVEAKAEMLESIRFTSDQEKVNLTFRNGDTLTGSLGIHEFEINTLFGKIRIETTAVISLEVLTGGACLQPALTNGLVLYFSFDRDEHGKVMDKSGKKNDGIINGAKWVQQGKRGGAYEFNGVSDHILVPDSDSLHMRSLTIMAWIYATDIAENKTIIEKRPRPLLGADVLG